MSVARHEYPLPWRPRLPRTSRLADLWMIVLLVIPIYGSFFSLESYLSLGQGEGLTGFALLPVPVTPISLVIIALSAAGYYLVARRHGRFQHDYLAYGLVLIAFASALWSFDTMLTIQRAVRLVPIVAFGLVLPQLYGRVKCLRLMTIAYLVAALLSIFMALAFPSLGVGRLGNGYESAWRGAIVHKNQAGAIFAIGVMITYCAWSMGAAGFRLTAAAGLACLLMVVKAESGTAVGALAVALPLAMALTFVQRRPSRLRGMLLASLLLGAVALTVAVLLGSDMLFGLAGRDTSFTGRTPIWSVVWGLIEQHPIRGHGYGFWNSNDPAKLVAWRQIGIDTGHSHQSWLDLWLQLGIFGMLAVAAIMLRGFWNSLRLILVTNDRMAPALFALLVLLLIRSMTEVQYSDPFPPILFFPIWILACTRLALRDRAAARRPRLAAPAVITGMPLGEPLAHLPGRGLTA